MTPPGTLGGVLDSSSARGFSLPPFDQAVGASIYSWPSLVKAGLQSEAPWSDVVVIAQNGNTSDDGLPSPLGEAGFNATAAETYFATPLTFLAIQFNQVALTTLQNITNFEAIETYATGLGSDFWVVTPHPCDISSGIDPLKLIELRDAVIARWPTRHVDAWTDFVDGSGLYALATYMLDDRHWNQSGHALFASIFSATTGYGA